MMRDALSLDPVTSKDLGWVNLAVDMWQGSQRWSIASQVPTFGDIEARVWLGVYAQRAVWYQEATPVALLQIVDIDLHNEIAALEFLIAPFAPEVLASSLEKFIHIVADDLPLRKVTFSCVSDTVPVELLFGNSVKQIGLRQAHERVATDRFGDVELYEFWCDEKGSR